MGHEDADIGFTLGACLGLSGCMEGGDPAEGGFVLGLSGVASGTYDDRISERETEVPATESRNAALSREQQGLAAQIGVAERSLAQENANLSRLKQSTLGLDAATRARIDEVLLRTPAGRTESVRLAELQKTIADARQLSAELARL